MKRVTVVALSTIIVGGTLGQRSSYVVTSDWSCIPYYTVLQKLN